MNILGIETSCDETAAAVVKDGREVLSNVVYTQIPLHQPYGGVVPEIASRAHIEKISEVVRTAIDQFNSNTPNSKTQTIRKVILATSIAETSVTIEGITCVIDSGLMRVPRFSPSTGMSGLVTLPLTQDRAEQRRGRAGRVRAGVCYEEIASLFLCQIPHSPVNMK